MSRPHENSWNGLISQLEVGGRMYVETTLEGYPHTMRTVNGPRSRRPASMAGMEFTTTLFTAVSASKAGDVRILVCVERTH